MPWEGYATLAAGSQTITALAPAAICPCADRSTVASDISRQRSIMRTPSSSSAVMPRPAMATGTIGSATSFVIGENGPISIPTGSRSVFSAIMRTAP